MRASDDRTLLFLIALALIAILATWLSVSSKRSGTSAEQSQFMTVIAPAQEGR